MLYNPWGNGSNGLNYYQWNGGWGYLWFNDLKLYYVHGRWWNADTGMFLSPDEKGEYSYGSGQDAANVAWICTYRTWAAFSTNVHDIVRFFCGAGFEDPGILLSPDELNMMRNDASFFGIPPDLLAATSETEMRSDTKPIVDPLYDELLASSAQVSDLPNATTHIREGRILGPDSQSMASALLDWSKGTNNGLGPGINHFHTANVYLLEKYYSENYSGTAMAASMQSPDSFQSIVSTLYSFSGSTRYTAAYLRMYADIRKNSRVPHLSDLTFTDEEVVYEAYRCLIGPGGCYTRIIDFQTATGPNRFGDEIRPTLARYREFFGVGNP